MSKKASLYIFIGALFILGISMGFFVARILLKPTPPAPIQDNGQNEQLFNSQTASLRGEITAVEGNDLTIKNLNTNAVGVFRASSQVSIIKPGSQTQIASNSASLSSLELNKEVLISLQMINGNYQATSIQYTLPAPSLPAIPNSGVKPNPSATN